MVDISHIVDELNAFTKARSIFLYGSRARSDFYSGSDYEIGVIMDRQAYISRSELKAKFDIDGINIFPFYYDDFISGYPDTPFQKTIHLRELVESGRTLSGENILGTMPPPAIHLADLLQEVRFNLGYALAATHSFRNDDPATAALHLAKSCLFGTRDYAVFKLRTFVISYDDILAASKKYDLGVFAELPEHAYRLRKRQVEIDERHLFHNITYLHQFVENTLLRSFRENGDQVIVP